MHVVVPPSAADGYRVVVRAGVLQDAAAHVAAAAPAPCYAVISPSDLAPLYGAPVADALRAAGLTAELLTFAAGPACKTRATWSALTDRLLELGLGRDGCVVAVGGGVTGDVAGFVAATYMRGVQLVQVPTTLLAMIDASVGGKTGVDTPAGKNLLGAFHSPRLVLVDPHVLHTLPPAELRAGMAEAIKHGAILDAAYFERIGADADALLAGDSAAVEHLIARSVELKSGIVAEDPYERGRRAILNFGHTIGHALEQHTGYRVPHGFAVAAGMLAEAALGETVGVTQPGTRAALLDVLQRFDLGRTELPPLQELTAAMRMDKKARRAAPRFVLLSRIGECARAVDGAWTHGVDATALEGRP